MTTSPDDVSQLIKNGSDIRTDWLAEDTPLTDIATTMAAMANSQGGTLLLGVGKSGEITGVANTAKSIDYLLQAALSIEPALIIPLPQVVKIKRKKILTVHIPRGMPHVYSLDGRYLRRKNTLNSPLKPRELRRLMIERGELSFEMEIAHGAGLDDIDWDKARTYVEKLRGIGKSDVEETLVKRGCLRKENDQLHPTNAGILLFGENPQHHIQGADITAARFAGEVMGDTFSRQDVTGTLPDQIRRAETFLVDHLRKGIQLRGTMARQEQFEYPMEAARELLVNAVAHRDYSIKGDGIRLFIFSDHMEVNSPGGLPGPVTVDNIKDERFSRNPTIVQVLSDMGFIERLGYGVDRVIELMQRQSLRAPEFQERARSFRVALYNRRIPGQKSISRARRTDEEIVFNGIYQEIRINPRQEAALIFLHTGNNTRITNSDLKRLCPGVHPETIRRDLVALVNKGILSKMGEKRGSYYVLKGNEKRG